MFDERFVAEYKNIQAPDELYDRIMNSAPKKEKKNNVVLFRRIAASAAAVAIIAVSVFVLMPSGSTPKVYVGDEQLTGEVLVSQVNNSGIMLARAESVLECRLTVAPEKDTRVMLSEGILCDNDGNELLLSGEERVFAQSFDAVWRINAPDTEKTYTVTLENKKETYFIELSFDSTSGNWVARLTK